MSSPKSNQREKCTETLRETRAAISVSSDSVENEEGDFQYEVNRRNEEKIGKFFIFNQTFEGIEGMERMGTNEDVKALTKVAKNLRFDVETFKNRTVKEIEETLKSYAEKYHSESYSCFACAFLSHGRIKDGCHEVAAYCNREEGQVEEDYIKLEDVLKYFNDSNCPSLSKKPKFFFIQACRWNTKKVLTRESVKTPDLKEVRKLCIAPEAHFFVAQSTLPESFSIRDQTTGSTFIQTLCKSFQEFIESEEMFTPEEVLWETNAIMSVKEQEFYSEVKNETQRFKIKQLAPVTSQLTKDFYFGKEKPEKAFVDLPEDWPERHSNFFFIVSSKRYKSKFGTLDQNKLFGTAKIMRFSPQLLSYNNKTDLFEQIDSDLRGKVYNGYKGVFAFALLATNDGNPYNDNWEHDPTIGELLDKFSSKKFPQLENIPKLFFLQVFDPNELDCGQQNSKKFQSIPSSSPYADMLVVHSRSKLYKVRQTTDGTNKRKSVFVRNLCKCLIKYQYQSDIMQIIRRVNFEMEKKDKRVPLVTSLLRAPVTMATKTD